MIGLVTGFQPFAGLPTNPAELVLDLLDGVGSEGAVGVTDADPDQWQQRANENAGL